MFYFKGRKKIIEFFSFFNSGRDANSPQNLNILKRELLS